MAAPGSSRSKEDDMPRHDWRNDDDFMTRDDRDRGYGNYGGRTYDDYEALFGRDRGEAVSRRSRMGGWGSLLNDESSGARDMRSRDRSNDRMGRSFGPDDNRRDVPRDETERLIASNKVEGTPVYDRNGDRLGTIHNFMVDKFRGQVVYAVLKHGSGFLGLDDRYYPLDWDQLSYDEHLGGYHIAMREDELKARGSWDRNERWQDRDSGMRPDRERMERGRGYERGMRDPW
jgi:sporulation protein YlmC with PRC-barrel domain